MPMTIKYHEFDTKIIQRSRIESVSKWCFLIKTWNQLGCIKGKNDTNWDPIFSVQNYVKTVFGPIGIHLWFEAITITSEKVS